MKEATSKDGTNIAFDQLGQGPPLVLIGGESEPFFHDGTQALANDLPNAQHRVLADQGHTVAPEALVPVLGQFFSQ